MNVIIHLLFQKENIQNDNCESSKIWLISISEHTNKTNTSISAKFLEFTIFRRSDSREQLFSSRINTYVLQLKLIIGRPPKIKILFESIMLPLYPLQLLPYVIQRIKWLVSERILHLCLFSMMSKWFHEILTEEFGQ